MHGLVSCGRVGWARALSPALALALAACLGGCSNLHPLKLHSEVRQKQGEDAAKAWKEVDLKPLFDADRANLAGLRQLEIDAWNRHQETIYQGELRELSALPAGAYRGHFLQALEGLAGPVAKPQQLADASGRVSAALRAVRKEGAATLELARIQSFLKSQRVPVFSCEQLLTKTEIVKAWKIKEAALAASPDVIDGLKDSTDRCGDITRERATYVAKVGELEGGSLKQRVEGWNADQKELLRRQAEVDDALIKVKVAQQAYDDALVKGQLPSEDAKDKAKKLADAIKKLSQAQQAFGVELASKESIEHIDELLKSLQEGKELSADSASKLEVAISMFPKIADSLQAVKNSKATAAVPLLIQRDMEQARLASARVETTRLKQSVELRAAVVFATLQQANAVVTAIKRMDDITGAGQGLLAATAKAAGEEIEAQDKVLNNPQSTKDQIAAARAVRDKREAAVLDGVWPKLSPDDRFFVLEASARYLDVYARLESPVRTAETTRLSLAMDRNVDLSEVNANLWTALIGSSVTQAAEYASLGFKADDFKWLLNFLALGYIGHGVDK